MPHCVGGGSDCRTGGGGGDCRTCDMYGGGDTFHGGSLGWHTGTGLLLVVLRHRHSISHREGIP